MYHLLVLERSPFKKRQRSGQTKYCLLVFKRITLAFRTHKQANKRTETKTFANFDKNHITFVLSLAFKTRV